VLKIDSMIHKKDLRFGNKVQTLQGEIITIQQLLCNTIIYDTQLEVSGELSDIRGYNNFGYSTQMSEVIKEIDYLEIEPIVLTAEILEKCGFRNFLRDECIYTVGNKHYDFEFNDKGLRLGRPAPPSQISIKYLHQLQNFIFAITNHELEVENVGSFATSENN
jgi:hypothetical protein